MRWAAGWTPDGPDSLGGPASPQARGSAGYESAPVPGQPNDAPVVPDVTGCYGYGSGEAGGRRPPRRHAGENASPFCPRSPNQVSTG